jgi:hypothetical protein
MDTDIESRVSKVAESILGNEALTSYLDDEAADLFLNWAVAKGEVIARSTIGMDEIIAEEVMYPRLKALRRIARYVGRWVIGSGEPRDLVEKIIEQARLVYGEEFVEPDPVEKQRFAQYPPGIEQVLVVLGLKNLFEGEDDGTEEEI